MKAEPELQEIYRWFRKITWEKWYTLKKFWIIWKGEIQLFWQLKAKIDDYKKQIIHACAEVDNLTKIINKIEAKVNE